MKKTKLITLTNDFHGTEITIRVKAKDNYYIISRYQMNRMWKILCGHKDCTCSNSMGTRGSEYVIEPVFQGDVAGRLFDYKYYFGEV